MSTPSTRMPSILQRMRVMRTILKLRVGPGAAVLPKEVQKLRMDFGAKVDHGNAGARHFWREILPRLKYRNPGVRMVVQRYGEPDPEKPSQLTITWAPRTGPAAQQQQQQNNNNNSTDTTTASSPEASAAAAAADPPVTTTGRTTIIDMRHRTPEQILEDLVRATGAEPIPPTPEDVAEARELEELAERSRRDAELSRQVRAQKRKEAEMLKQARGMV